MRKNIILFLNKYWRQCEIHSSQLKDIISSAFFNEYYSIFQIYLLFFLTKPEFGFCWLYNITNKSRTRVLLKKKSILPYIIHYAYEVHISITITIFLYHIILNKVHCVLYN